MNHPSPVGRGTVTGRKGARLASPELLPFAAGPLALFSKGWAGVILLSGVHYLAYFPTISDPAVLVVV